MVEDTRGHMLQRILFLLAQTLGFFPRASEHAPIRDEPMPPTFAECRVLFAKSPPDHVVICVVPDAAIDERLTRGIIVVDARGNAASARNVYAGDAGICGVLAEMP